MDSTADKFAALYLLNSKVHIYNDPALMDYLGFRANRAIKRGVIGAEGDS
jgi:hypothetical protein